MTRTDENSLELSLPRKRLSGCACHSPLAHFYIHHSESSVLEIHPFTTITHLASKKPLVQKGEQSISIQFLFRQSVLHNNPQSPSQPPLKKSTQWTNKLASLADEEKADTNAAIGAQTSLRLEGPYFTPANPESYKTVICLVAGTGLSGALAIAAAFQAQRGRKSPQSPTREANTTGNTESPYPGGATTEQNSRSKHQPTTKPLSPVAAEAPCTVARETSGRWTRCIVLWAIRESDFVEMPFFKGMHAPHNPP